MTDEDTALPWREAESLADEVAREDASGRADTAHWLENALAQARGKEFLLVHNPGGWGNALLDDLQDWERSIVDGVDATMEELRHSWALVQYFRSRDSFWHHMREIGKETVFFFRGKSVQAQVMAAQLSLLLDQMKGLRVILVGASQGAAFGNTVMRYLGEAPRVYSIELGIFFPHMPRRVITERTLAIDSNGLMRDPMANRDLWAGFRAYFKAFFRWLQYRLRGKRVKFTNCINVPGHEYRWEFPEVSGRVKDFLRANFGTGQQ